MSTTTTTMRAWTYTQSGLPSQTVVLDEEAPAPTAAELAPDELLIAVNYVAMNSGFTTMMRSLPPQPYSLPHIYNRQERLGVPEFEFSGRILAVGSAIPSTRPDLQPSILVLGCCAAKRVFVQGKGALAERVIAPAAQLIPLQAPGPEPTITTQEDDHEPRALEPALAPAPAPATLSLLEASGLSACGCTAVQVLDLTKLIAGDKLFVNGGSTSVGMLIIQVARHVLGPTGTIVASGTDAALIRSIGADEVVDYQAQHPLHEYLRTHHADRPFDAIIDCVGVTELYTRCAPYLASGKPFINLGAMTARPTFWGLLSFVWNQHMVPLWPVVLGGVPRRYQFYSARPNRESLGRVMRLVQNGELKMVVDSVWEMADAKMAYERMESHRAKGKVIVRVQEE
ncbi:hypothetical protein ASPACDRAFT_1886862 [Aspergillus aculeatus ATCC 16872]|uniref:Enoyl reductase (ER) domain-containing protein n=1 Tax=Aspergillus aculeatus (strain ATCC 16872 / CBS 172.66 / WB 5094) TaxID=690307 RepID=A0A1L9WXY8_ASPA1|nr:uncharacterized protein ASPACDRAFT_1886862 [Aspergillus aculeatus ATCC 16872]OJK01145.1 hypothetical protein ASPACDRAFT_1886862 [Aspergillus aculeatus ATCC 16872]